MSFLIDVFWEGETWVLRMLKKEEKLMLGYKIVDEPMEEPGFFFVFVINSFKIPLVEMLLKQKEIVIESCPAVECLLQNGNIFKALLTNMTNKMGVQNDILNTKLIPRASMIKVSCPDIMILKNTCQALYMNQASRGDLFSYIPVEMAEINFYLWQLIKKFGINSVNEQLGESLYIDEHVKQKENVLKISLLDTETNMKKNEKIDTKNLFFKRRQKFISMSKEFSRNKWPCLFTPPFGLSYEKNVFSSVNLELLQKIKYFIPIVSIVYELDNDGAFLYIMIVLKYGQVTNTSVFLMDVFKRRFFVNSQNKNSNGSSKPGTSENTNDSSKPGTSENTNDSSKPGTSENSNGSSKPGTSENTNPKPECSQYDSFVLHMFTSEKELIGGFIEEYSYGRIFQNMGFSVSQVHFLCAVDLVEFKRRVFLRSFILGLRIMDRLMQFNEKRSAMFLNKNHLSVSSTKRKHNNYTPSIPKINNRFLFHGHAIEVENSFKKYHEGFLEKMQNDEFFSKEEYKSKMKKNQTFTMAGKKIFNPHIPIMIKRGKLLTCQERFSSAKCFEYNSVKIWTVSTLIENFMSMAKSMAFVFSPFMVFELLNDSFRWKLFPSSIGKMTFNEKTTHMKMFFNLMHGHVSVVNKNAQWEPVLKIPRLSPDLFSLKLSHRSLVKTMEDIKTLELHSQVFPRIQFSFEYLNAKLKNNDGPKVLRKTYTIRHKLFINIMFNLKSLIESCAFVPIKKWNEYIFFINNEEKKFPELKGMFIVPLKNTIDSPWIFKLNKTQIDPKNMNSWQGNGFVLYESFPLLKETHLGVFFPRLGNQRGWEEILKNLKYDSHDDIMKKITSMLDTSLSGEFFSKYFYYIILQYTLRIIPFIWNYTLSGMVDITNSRTEEIQCDIEHLFNNYGNVLNFFTKPDATDETRKMTTHDDDVIINFVSQDVINFSVLKRSSMGHESDFETTFLEEMNKHFSSFVFPGYVFENTFGLEGNTNIHTTPIPQTSITKIPISQEVYSVTIYNDRKVLWLNHRPVFELDHVSVIMGVFEHFLFLILKNGPEKSVFAMRKWSHENKHLPGILCSTNGTFRSPNKRSSLHPFQKKFLYVKNSSVEDFSENIFKDFDWIEFIKLVFPKWIIPPVEIIHE